MDGGLWDRAGWQMENLTRSWLVVAGNSDREHIDCKRGIVRKAATWLDGDDDNIDRKQTILKMLFRVLPQRRVNQVFVFLFASVLVSVLQSLFVSVCANKQFLRWR